MKLKQVLEIQEVLGKTIPIDMNHKWGYHSESRGEWVDIMDLDIVHAIRILRKYAGRDEIDIVEDIDEYYEKGLKSLEEIT